MKILALLAALTFNLSFVFADDWKPIPIEGITMRCFQEKEPVEWSFCLNTVEGSKNNDLIYHFHGRNGAATWWNDRDYYTGKVYAKWLEKKYAPPTVATVSFGKLWFLTERSDEKTGGLYHVFMDQVTKRVEKEIGNPISRRFIIGESMGGVNALITAFKSGKTFYKVAALCAPIQTISPYASVSEIYHYVTEATTSWKHALMMMFFSRRFFPSEEIWNDNDPLQLSVTAKPDLEPIFYLSCGKQDDWGCDIDIDTLTDFLMK
jgi:hypothetical protein